MKVLGKIWKFIVLLLIILVVAAILIPYIYEDEIKEAIKESINDEVNAVVDFEDVSLSLFKSFPKIALDIEDIKITGKDDFDGINLFKAGYIRLNSDLSTIIDKETPINIASIEIDNAVANIIINKAGVANYDIIPPSSNDSEAADFQLQLDQYSLSNSSIKYHDLSTDVFASLEEIDHQGSGDFTKDIFDLKTETSVKKLTVKSGGIKYLNNAKLKGQNNIKINNNENSYRIDNNQFSINRLTCSIDGDVKMNESIWMDLSLNTPNSTFADILTAIPNGYKGEMANIDAKGKAKLEGKIKGNFNSATNRIPSYEFDLSVVDGYAKFPNSAAALDKVMTDINVKSDGRNTSVNIPTLHIESGTNVIKGNLLVDEVIDNPKVKGAFIADANLSEISQAFTFEGISTLSGSINSDLTIDATIDDIEKANYENITFTGDFKAKDIIVNYDESPSIGLPSLNIKADPKQIVLEKSLAQLGKSDLSFDGVINNPLAYFIKDTNLSGSLNTYSNKIDLNEWISEEETTGDVQSIDQEIESLVKNASFDVNMVADTVYYGAYTLTNNTAQSLVSGEQIDLQNYEGQIFDNPIQLSGKLNNLFDFVMKNEILTGDLEFVTNKLNVNPFLGDGTDTASVEIYRAPKNMDIVIATKMKNVKYQKIFFQEMNGGIKMKNGVISFNEVASKALGGSLNFEGLYDSTVEEPLFSLKYDMSKVSFERTFESIPSVQKLAGIMGLIEGIFNSTLVMEANLNDKMFPNLSTINAQGFIETLTGKLKEVGPLKEVSNKLGVKEFGELDISNTKNWFEIENGKVGLKPEEYNYQGINFIVSGTHGYDTDMSYTMLAKIPRSKFKESSITNIADKGLSYLEGQAGKLGININQGEFINLRIDIGGTLFKPKINIVPLGSEGQTVQDQVKDEITNKVNETKDTIIEIANEKVEELKDTVTTVVEGKIDTITSQINDKVNEKIDTLQSQIESKIEEKVDTIVGDILGDKLDTLLNDQIDTLLQGKLEDILGDEKDKEVDKIKDKLKDWNPFKKKKGN